jgi:ATP phosphoribosyltransferase
VMLRSQANLIASRAASWGEGELATAAVILDRIEAQARARRYKEVRTRFAGCNDTLLDLAKTKFGVATPFGGPTSSGMLTLHCPPDAIHRLAMFLREHGAESVIVADIEYVFTRDNPLFAKLKAAVRR